MKYLLSICILLVFSLSIFGQQGRQDKLVGKSVAPNLKLTTMDGKDLETKDLHGKVVVYNLWSISCPPCREEIPELNKIVAEYAGKDVIFIALGVDNKTRIEDYIKKNPFDFQIVPDASKIMLFSYGEVKKDGSLDLPFPTHVVVNRKGFVELKIQGTKGVDAVREELKIQFEGSESGEDNLEKAESN